jgi:GTP-binding protein
VFRVDAGWYLVDLPGYGFARVSRDERRAFRRLLDRYIDERASLAGVVWLLDIRRDPSADDLDMAARFAARRVPLLAAITKSDKLPFGRRQGRLSDIAHDLGLPEDQCVLTSARTGEGVRDLRDSIEALAARR